MGGKYVARSGLQPCVACSCVPAGSGGIASLYCLHPATLAENWPLCEKSHNSGLISSSWFRLSLPRRTLSTFGTFGCRVFPAGGKYMAGEETQVIDPHSQIQSNASSPEMRSFTFSKNLEKASFGCRDFPARGE